jgi:hypothetical protein
MRAREVDFLKLSQAHNIGLNPIIEASLRNNVQTAGKHIVARTPLLKGIVQAGHLLREQPNIGLAERPLKPRNEFKDPALRALAGIVNTSIERPTDHPNYFESGPIARADACADAENFFLSADNGYQIIVNDEGKEILIRKSEGARTSLSLDEININGVIYPPLSVFRAEIGEPETDWEELGYRSVVEAKNAYGDQLPSRIDPNRVEVVSMDQVTSIGFLRLSLWGLAKADQKASTRGIKSLSKDLQKRLLTSDPREVFVRPLAEAAV